MRIFHSKLNCSSFQGTRTIIDNLDTGKSVLPILTNYEGISDCIDACMNNEGVLGLYKGFGALILQYAVHIAVVRLTRAVLMQALMLLRPKAKKTPVEHSPPVIPNSQEQGDSYLLP